MGILWENNLEMTKVEREESSSAQLLGSQGPGSRCIGRVHFPSGLIKIGFPAFLGATLELSMKFLAGGYPITRHSLGDENHRSLFVCSLEQQASANIFIHF